MKLHVPIWMKIVFYIENNNKSVLSYKIKSPYSVIDKNVKQLIKNNILYKDEKNKKDKRSKNYALTEKGKKIKDNLITINKEISFIEIIEGF